MKYDYEEWMKKAFYADAEPDKEINKMILGQCKEECYMGFLRRNKKAIAIATCCLVLAGGTTVDAATGGEIHKAVGRFFSSVVYDTSSDEAIQKYQDVNGNYVIGAGSIDEELAGDELSQSDSVMESVEQLQDSADGIESEGWRIITSEDKEMAILKFVINNRNYYSITTAFEKWMDEEDRIWELRSNLYNFLYNDKELIKEKQSYIDKLLELENKIDKEYVKEAVALAISDIQSGKQLIFDQFPLSAKEMNLESEDPDEIVDAAWTLIDLDEIDLINDRGEIIKESSQGVKKTIKFVVEKDSDIEGKYVVRSAELVK
ncbi:MAG: hypothetical protein K2J90_00950 [Lachnospiraceae bacterium]|nr:hypothetical protein [Lachnospiraceae bacterium]